MQNATIKTTKNHETFVIVVVVNLSNLITIISRSFKKTKQQQNKQIKIK